MSAKSDRRKFLLGGTALAGGLTAGAWGQEQSPAHHGHDGPVGGANDRGKLTPGRRTPGQPPVPVETPDGSKLPWKMVGGVKEFHLHARHTRREFLPDMWFDVWGYNGDMPGPTVEAVEGDRVRFVVHNELPESTTVHWHGLEVPNRMDGVHGLNQEPIKPGATFAYEFTLHQNGTFFYHSHGPMQEGIGMAGLFIIHPRTAHEPLVDKDFALLIQEWAILPQCTVPNTMSMEFNFFTLNGRSAPYVTPLVVRLGDRVRIRFVNMSPIDHHPMHLHGHTFWVTGTEGGRVPETAWVPGNNVLVGVAQARDVEFVANNPGDWMIHCHMFHHMMNHMTSMVGQMGHGMPAGGDMANSMGMITRGPALSPEHGPHLGRGTGEQTGTEREVRNGSPLGRRETDPGYRVPGYPQDMMDMHGMYPPGHVAKFNKPEMRGMRRNWYAGVEGLMTMLRVLPPELYDKVASGKGEVEPGASVPGAGPGEMPGMSGHHMPGHDKPKMPDHGANKK
ncbi:MAG TPA: copper oxidase [Fimbriiglobus sp.]|nr:copper oxidase [Fimbriiglobus sp.]